MPFSYDTFDHYVGTMLDLLQPATALDIGPGAGKFSSLAKASGERCGYKSTLTAVEIDETYVHKFELATKYDEVILGDGMTLIDSPRVRFEFCFIGDCIEHLRKSDGLDLINFLFYRTGY